MLEWSKYDSTNEPIACVVSESFLSRAKWLSFLGSLFDNISVIWVKHLSQHWAICDCFIISF